MKYIVSVNETLCDVNVYLMEDDCDTSKGDCGEWVGSFSFEKIDSNVTVHTWNFQRYDFDAAKIAVQNFMLKWVPKNNVQKIFVERSEADMFWQNLGVNFVDKCLMLEKSDNECV